MRQVVQKLALMVVTPFAFAENALPPPPPQLVLDKIDFQLSAKQWVTTKTALLGVNINVTLNNADLVKARSDIMERLNKIAKGDWHLVQFDRSQDSSGLEKLFVQAQARVGQEVLTDIYQNAKTVSLPGAQYEISSVDFKPSFEETQIVLTQIRQRLYQQVNNELARINKAYPTQNYSVSNLVFVDGNNPPQPRPYQAKEMNTMLAVAAPAAPALTVSNELILTAIVEVAANRKQ
ncbi:hypothetical protein [Legionella longbeachae]|uniref:DUF541 domain-containing protein n=1 Tax=Legionella longbeachae serogroup 1 (strain NSW150) TaxID=661367 RepID=D3HPX5_LEGLN|nr:hypothetical protein [Legionella longbeachae]VEE01460.1 Uncharacterised protein [Legionella oakridgensis]HBD7396178.1 hypothetical protein [Legionella pneumophila]ARB92180.1 hypothetical protein A6J40_08315 [Legionella longbeachae]ARM34640.1 hypothetical protein B0B39_14410 [Legionella longbeachae]EEZ96059.1 conserved hypothetical protein [Legionella longbeachae D-4968]